ncbi:undecaprenyldiphospho-muramoylpentapeptide beta-N-acetylglucosaminyltransferase [Salinispirillum marinum]|uniref:UDP-N-acetylglucosamine--N-acetylmuramyl-(pentapeptide) pyrophosphoryl-undecaprenol N-acetylglucosamine transferase n=2 Tax=Saccharospirillaceae TaxID=255527 RepID=A0ABV8B9D7_9GAMM
MTEPRVLIMAGGTGGHVFPALAVAERLQQRHVAVAWLGTAKGIENTVVPAAGLTLHRLTVTGVRGKSGMTRILAPWFIVQSIWQAWRLIQQLKPQAVLGMGGYASGPGGIAAWLSRVPLIIHEQNAVAGTTNRLLSRFARTVLSAFPRAFGPDVAAQVVGNPVRAELCDVASPVQRGLGMKKPYRLLVLGGSQGALAINQCVPKALALLAEDERPQVLHQCGAVHLAATEQAYAEANVVAQVTPFIDDMGAALLNADAVVARAGALTVAEIAAVGLGSILIPFPHAIDDHQTANAQTLADIGAATLLQQDKMTPDTLARALEELLQHETLLNRAAAARAAGMPEATERVVRELEKYMGEKA